MDNFEWENFEKFIGHEVPKCLKILLRSCGYDSLYSLKQITSERIIEMELFIDTKKQRILSKLDDDNNDKAVIQYKKQSQFVFLPGHHDILLNIPNNIKEMQSQWELVPNANDSERKDVATEYSTILSQLIKTAERNKNRSKHANQYDDIIKYFSTYIFLLCGRTCYETLNRNLPIPSTKTICKYMRILEMTSIYINRILKNQTH